MRGREKVVALTGHRALQNFDEDALAYELESLIGEGYTAYLCGMAQGFDLPVSPVRNAAAIWNFCRRATGRR